MSKSIKLDGTEYPVTDHFARSIAHLKADSFALADVEAERRFLLQVSNVRKLTKIEYARLESLTHLKNVGNAIKFVGNRPLSDFEFEGWDQVHGNRCTHACGCATQYIFDHHKARANEAHNHHPHQSYHVCDDHQHLATDFRAHFKALHGNA